MKRGPTSITLCKRASVAFLVAHRWQGCSPSTSLLASVPRDISWEQSSADEDVPVTRNGLSGPDTISVGDCSGRIFGGSGPDILDGDGGSDSQIGRGGRENLNGLDDGDSFSNRSDGTF